MRSTQRTWRWMAVLTGAVLAVAATTNRSATADEVLPTIVERYSDAEVTEEPSFQRHVVPLFGRLGCNGRACHGSFQGRGGFRLSLFGYDFQADHDALLDKESPRIDVSQPLESLILNKPVSEDEHEGGKRYEKGGWEYHVLRRWVEGGAKFDSAQIDKLLKLEIVPNEVIFQKKGEQVQLRAIAVWEDGTREDVTPLCRFTTNDSLIADVDTNGLVLGGEAGDTHVVVYYDKAVIPVPFMRAVSNLAGDNYPRVETPTKVDELIVTKLRKLGVVPSDVCSDAEFLRRVCLDLTGTLPTATEVEAFLADPSADKRAKKIDALLETPAYAAWWTTKLCDFTGNNDDQLNNVTPARTQASKDWYEWIYKRVSENVPYDKLAEGIVVATSRESGESYYDYCKTMSEISQSDERTLAERSCMPYYWARREFRQPPERAISFAYAFLGVRVECAQCHKHPFDQWSKHDFEEFSKFFAGVTFSAQSAPNGREDYQRIMKDLNLGDARGGNQRNAIADALRDGKVVPFPEVYATNRAPTPARNTKGRPAATQPPREASLLGAGVIDLNAVADPRQPLMDWLRSPENPYFARAFVNRVWAAYFGIGIVEPPDDHSLANPPSNAPLLDHLAQSFIASGFDMKTVHREILNSRTYQLSWRPNDTNEQDNRNFARAYVRRMPAEVVYDAIRQATASDDEVAQLQVNVSARAIATPGAGVRGNQNRDTTYALTVFGRSTREGNCDCDRSAVPSLLQTVYLQNDSDVLKMLDRTKTGWLDQVTKSLAPSKANAAAVDDVATLKGQLETFESQLERLRTRGNKTQIEAAEKRINLLRERVAKLEDAGSAKGSSDVIEPAKAEQIVKQAYLRTVSRYPTQEELTRSVQYIKESESTTEGVRGVLWALLNTKEFIVNH